MNEEEKKAIDILINEIADIVIGEYCTHCKICENEDIECYYIKTIDTVYSLIEKQQKEIEELKKENRQLKQCNNNIYATTVDKAKIREKIEVLENIIEWEKPTYKETLDYTIDILKELLEES